MEGMEQIVSRLVQIGSVTAVDAAARKVRVKFKNSGLVSGWLSVLQHYGTGVSIVPDGTHTHSITDTYTGGGSASTEPDHSHDGTYTTYWLPPINATVVVLYLPAFNSDGIVLGGV